MEQWSPEPGEIKWRGRRFDYVILAQLKWLVVVIISFAAAQQQRTHPNLASAQTTSTNPPQQTHTAQMLRPAPGGAIPGRPHRPLVVRCGYDGSTRPVNFPSAASCRLESLRMRVGAALLLHTDLLAGRRMLCPLRVAVRAHVHRRRRGRVPCAHGGGPHRRHLVLCLWGR